MLGVLQVQTRWSGKSHKKVTFGEQLGRGRETRQIILGERVSGVREQQISKSLQTNGQRIVNICRRRKAKANTKF